MCKFSMQGLEGMQDAEEWGDSEAGEQEAVGRRVGFAWLVLLACPWAIRCVSWWSEGRMRACQRRAGQVGATRGGDTTQRAEGGRSRDRKDPLCARLRSAGNGGGIIWEETRSRWRAGVAARRGARACSPTDDTLQAGR